MFLQDIPSNFRMSLTMVELQEVKPQCQMPTNGISKQVIMVGEIMKSKTTFRVFEERIHAPLFQMER